MSNFTFTETKIQGVYIIDVKAYGDNRGCFMETYKERDFAEAGLNYKFVQDNQSCSTKGVLRGMHYQKQFPQAKLVRVISGAVFDVAVDLRKGSRTYGEWVGASLTEENHHQLMIPRGFAHGFVVTSDYAVFAYKCDDVYHPEDEGGFIWNDPEIGIQWPDVGMLVLNDKDKQNPSFRNSSWSFNL